MFRTLGHCVLFVLFVFTCFGILYGNSTRQNKTFISEGENKIELGGPSKFQVVSICLYFYTFHHEQHDGCQHNEAGTALSSRMLLS